MNESVKQTIREALQLARDRCEELPYYSLERQEEIADNNAALAALDEQPYSHRNGETEPPTIAGWYWFRGNVSSSYREPVPYSGSVTIFESTYENRGLCVISTDESPSSNIKKWQGHWYGPIVPPWEDSHE